MTIGVIVAVALIVAIVVAGVLEYDRRRKRASFGAEYEALVEQEGGRRAADREINRRRRAYSKLELRPLAGEERARHAADWRRVRESFVDDPFTALNDAEGLVIRLARSRGYPGGDEETLLGLLSVPHTDAVTGYREAVQVRQAADRDPQSVSTEQMRKAFQQYDALYEDMLTEAGSDERPQTSQDSASDEELSLEGRR